MAHFVAHNRKKFLKEGFGLRDVKELHLRAEKYLMTDAGKHLFWLNILRYGDPFVSEKFRKPEIKKEILAKMGINEERFNKKMVALNVSAEEIHRKENIEDYGIKNTNHYEEDHDMKGVEYFLGKEYGKAAGEFLDANQIRKYQVCCELNNMIEASVEAGAFAGIGDELLDKIIEKVKSGSQREKDTYKMIKEDFEKGEFFNLTDYYRKRNLFAEAGWIEFQISTAKEFTFNYLMDIGKKNLDYEHIRRADEELDGGLMSYRRSLDDLRKAFLASEDIESRIKYGNARLFVLRKLGRMLESIRKRKFVRENDSENALGGYRIFHEKEKEETKKMIIEAISNAHKNLVYRKG